MYDTEYQHDPFLPLRPISQPRTSDEEYVAKIAKSLQWWDRWRWLAILFHLAILGAVMWFGLSVVTLVQNLQNMWGNQNPNILPEGVVLIGIILGLKVGFFFHSSLMGVINALAGFRSERLLVQYFNKHQADTTNRSETFSPESAKEPKDAAELPSAVSQMASQSRQPADLGR